MATQTVEAPPRMIDRVDPRFVANRQGRDFALYAGLLDLAHQQGLLGIETKLEQAPNESNGQLAIVSAIVTFPPREAGRAVRQFTGIGDASPQNVGRMIAMHTVRMAECVPTTARILTRHGWQHHDDLERGQDVLAYDPDTGTCLWTPLEAVSVFPGQHEGLHLSSRSFDVRCTPNHTWATQRGLVEAQGLKHGDHIRVAAPAEQGTGQLSTREAAILGWVATDGTVRRSMVAGRWGPYLRIVIRQSKPHRVEELRALLREDAREYVAPARERDFGSYTSRCLPGHTFELTAEYAKHLWSVSGLGDDWSAFPRLVLTLSAPARAAMLETMLAGDGTSRRGRRAVFGKKRKPGVMAGFELLCTLQGIALGRPRTSSIGAVPVRSLRENDTVSAGYLHVEPCSIEDVWCPTTAFGTWIAEIDGTITITGNTRAKARAFRDALNIGGVALEELGPNGEGEDELDAGPPAERATSDAPRQLRAGAPRAHTAPVPAAASAVPVEREADAVRNAGEPASSQQRERLSKLQAALGRQPTIPRDLTAAQAAEQISELVRAFNSQSRKR